MTWQTSLQADFYPRPPRGGRPLIQSRLDETKIISIHALREEGDLCRVGHTALSITFLSTPSARRATPGLIDHH